MRLNIVFYVKLYSIESRVYSAVQYNIMRPKSAVAEVSKYTVQSNRAV